MNFDKFKPFWHESYHKKIQPWFESAECDKLYNFLKSESQRGKKLAPNSNLTYRCFLETPMDEVKVILLGYCPYHSFTKEGYPVADGLGFSCSVTGKLQPSLETFYEGLEEELYNGLNLEYFKDPDLLYLAKQGVLLWNSSLTVEANKAGSHQDKWKEFTRYILENVLIYNGIPIIFIGKDAAFFKRYTTPLTHGQLFEIEHPAFAARNIATWETKGVFGKVNRVIEANNKKPIKWLCSQEEIKDIIEGNEPPF